MEQIYRVEEAQNGDSLCGSLLRAVGIAVDRSVDICGPQDRPEWRSLDFSGADDKFDLHTLSALFTRLHERGMPCKFVVQDGRVHQVPKEDDRQDFKKAEYLSRIRFLEATLREQTARIEQLEDGNYV